EAVFLSGVTAVLDGSDVSLDTGKRRIVTRHEIPDEARRLALGDAEYVVQHEDLSVDVGPGADAYDRHLERAGNGCAYLVRYALQQHDVRTRRFERLRVSNHLVRHLALAALDFETPDL